MLSTHFNDTSSTTELAIEELLDDLASKGIEKDQIETLVEVLEIQWQKGKEIGTKRGYDDGKLCLFLFEFVRVDTRLYESNKFVC